jgi:hypothetical protein
MAMMKGRPSSPGAAGHLEGRLVGFGAGVREEHGGPGGQVEDVVEFLGQADLGRGGEEVRDVAERRGLLSNGLHPGGMAVAERVDGDAGEQVEVLLARGIPHIGALAADEVELRGPEHRGQHAGEVITPRLRLIRVHLIGLCPIDCSPIVGGLVGLRRSARNLHLCRVSHD